MPYPGCFPPRAKFLVGRDSFLLGHLHSDVPEVVHNHDHIVGEIDMVSQKIGLVQQDLMAQAYLLDFHRNG